MAYCKRQKNSHQLSAQRTAFLTYLNQIMDFYASFPPPHNDTVSFYQPVFEALEKVLT